MNKNLLLALATCVAIAAGAVAGLQANRATQANQRSTLLDQQLRDNEAKRKADADTISRLAAENKAFNEEAAALRAKLAANEKSAPPIAAAEPAEKAEPAKDPKKKAGFEGLFGKFMKDPKMKEMVRQQQAIAMKQLYADFIKSRNLSPQQADDFMKLLSEKQMEAMDDGMAAMNGDKTADANPADKADKATKSAERDRQMEMLLGDAGYSDYKSYEKTLGERMVLNQMRQQLSASSIPLDDTQAKTLMQVMTEERAKTPQTGLESSAPGSASDKMQALVAGKGDEFFQAQADMNQRVLSRAAAIMKPEQLSALAAFQKQQLEMQKLGIEMTRKMMGDEKDSK